MAGIGEEMGDVGLAIQRAEDKTAEMQARASAVDELIASGALDDMTAIGGQDDISRELESMSSHSDVESELARLKASAHGGEIAGSSSRASRCREPGRGAHAGRRGDARPAAAGGGLDPGGTGVIVRILAEGQYDVPEDALERLNELDAAVEAAVEAGDEAALTTALAALHDAVRSAGAGHDPDPSTSPT